MHLILSNYFRTRFFIICALIRIFAHYQCMTWPFMSEKFTTKGRYCNFM